MGDCGQYQASASVEFSLRKKGKNNRDDILEYMKKNTLSIKTDLDFDEEVIKEAFGNGDRIILEYKDWDSWDSNDGIDEVFDGMDVYHEECHYEVFTLREATEKDLEDLDLELLATFSVKDLNKNDLSYSVQVASVYESIYCDNDNTSMDTADTGILMELLQLPDAKLVLEGDGSGNC